MAQMRNRLFEGCKVEGWVGRVGEVFMDLGQASQSLVGLVEKHGFEPEGITELRKGIASGVGDTGFT